MRSFWYEFLGDKIEIIFSLAKNGKWWHHSRTGEKIGVKFEYPYPSNDDEIAIGMVDIEEMDSEVRSMLFQSLKMDAPEFGLSYS